MAKLISGQLVPGDDYGLLCSAIGIHLLDFDLFRAPAHAGQPLWCFEMRDADTPAVRLGQELALHLVEMRKADRQRECLPPALADWIILFEHWQEEDLMATIADGPVLKARDKLKQLSADTEARRLAFVREEGLEQGRKEGEDQALRTTAVNLIRHSDLDDAAIAAATGLTTAEIAALRKARP